MAAHSHHRVGSRISLAAGGTLGGQQLQEDLPGGACNFRDLSTGARAPVCGCKKFWLHVGHFGGQDGERAWCFCGHHACFHSAFSQQRQQQQEHHQVQLPAHESLLAAPRMSGIERYGNTNQAEQQSSKHARRTGSPLSKPITGLGIQPGSPSRSPSIDTRVLQALNDFARNQDDGGMSDTSKLPSTAAPSVVDEAQLSPNRIMQDRLQLYRPMAMAPPIAIPQNSTSHPKPAEEYSATEVATPSVAGTPDFRALASSNSNTRVSPGHLPQGRIESHIPVQQSIREEVQPHLPSTDGADEQRSTTTMSAQDVQSMLQAYGRRIDILESLSFSHVPVEEVQERFELFDGRLLDLEQWRSERDQNSLKQDSAEQSGSRRRQRLLPSEKSSFDSEASFDINAAAHTEAAVLATLAANAETFPRIDALENRVTDLENAALPSFARPWHVQVVLLPWGRELRGIWFSSIEATQHSMRSSTQISDEWTGAQLAPKLSFKSSTSGAWTTESIQAWANEAQEWLSPKACGPSGMVFRRLASRGLVRDVTLTSPDSRHVLDSIKDAFTHVPGSEPELGLEELKCFQGLHEPFIPLRKVRKSSRLRFLSPAEMVTSASWTASFLDTSVFMKVNDGRPRLYITTSEAYFQPNHRASSWQEIRNLPMYDASGEEQAAQATSAVTEACWTYNGLLDRPPSTQSSFASGESQWSIHSHDAADEHAQQPPPPVSPRSEIRPIHRRTVSLPNSNPTIEDVREILPKRRVASFETRETLRLPRANTESSGAEILATASKRRRISLSPEAERRGVNFTPRWSREPPSPFTSEANTAITPCAMNGSGSVGRGVGAGAEIRSVGGTSSRRRDGATPFAYATPHSSSYRDVGVGVTHLESLLGSGDGDGDTEAGTDVAGRGAAGAPCDDDRGGEEEWEGVDDDDDDGTHIHCDDDEGDGGSENASADGMDNSDFDDEDEGSIG